MTYLNKSDLPPIRKQRNILKDSLTRKDRARIDHLRAIGWESERIAEELRIAVKTVDMYRTFMRARYRRSD